MANNRRIYIINPEFQYRFCLILCGIAFVISLIYPLVVFDIINMLQADYERVLSQLPAGASIIDFQEVQKGAMFLLFMIIIAVLCLTFVAGIIISHKIAGPMYKMTMFLQKIREGGVIHELTFRDGDQFEEVAEELNETLEYLTSRDEDELEYLTEVATYIENIALVVPEDKKPVLEEIQRKIEDFKRLHQTY
ncbi:MAG: hypothetical protein CME65_12000 [Halobacteriovoraceae bacterium]|nr:hypothetical protein [Halobacteriovoraceae bacterium]